MEVKLHKYVDDYNENQRLMKALKNDKETWEEKLTNLKAMAVEITAKEKSLQESLDVALLSKKEFEGQVSELTNELTSTSGVYFQHARQQVSFFYPKLDMRKSCFLKDVCEDQLVDERFCSLQGHPGQ